MITRCRTTAAILFFASLAFSAAVVSAESNCNDGLDNDGDGFIDHLDTTCYETDCTDGLDNDGDGHYDELAAGTPLGNEGPDPDCQCLDDVAGFTSGCTANDVSFVLIGLGTQSDGCVNSSDFITILMGAQLTTTANTRYDVGMWVGTDFNTALTARTGRSCRREILTPVSETATTAQICAAAGTGPYIDLDDPTNDTSDRCGEAQTANNCGTVNGSTVNALFTFSTPITLPCSRTANGLLNLSTCSTWDNQSSNGGVQKPHCTNFTEAIPGTSSKCRCDDATVTNIPKPNLALTCGCTAVANGVTTCTVSYTNAGQGTCNQTAATADTEFGCGVARYIRFKTSYPSDSEGSITTSPASTRGSIGDDTTNNVLTWTPGTNPANTLGWIGVNETDSMTFSFTTQSQTSGTLTFATTAYWSNVSDFSPEISQAASLSCSTTIEATPVTLSEVEISPEGEDLVLRWTTATEAGNAGFHVYAETAEGLERLNRQLVPSHAVSTVAPQTYELRLPARGRELEEAAFYVEDVSVSGSKRRQGPFAVTAGRAGHPFEAREIDWAAVSVEHQRELGRRALSPRAGAPQSPAVDLLISRDGLYRLTYEDLVATGLVSKQVRAASLALRNAGAQVPMRVVASGPLFGPGSYLEFRGRALDTLYTGTNVYRLSVEAKAGARAGSDPSAPSTAPAAPWYWASEVVEREREYGFSAPNGDPWYDTLFQGFPGGTSADFSFAADHLAGTSGELVVDLWGMTDWPVAPDHHVRLRWNGAEIAEARFDGQEAPSVRVALPAGALREGSNTLSIDVPNDLGQDYDFLALDRFSVTYPRAFVARNDGLSFRASGARFEVDGFSEAGIVAYREDGSGGLVHLAGARVRSTALGYAVSFPGTRSEATYWVAAGAALKRPELRPARLPAPVLEGTADYVVISHPDFVDRLSTWVAAREGDGYRVRVVDVRDVYSTFSHGVLDAEAIRVYLRQAAATMGVRYVLLVGGDTYDPRNFLGRGSISFIPSLYRATSPYVNFAPVDAAYADLDDDGVPDLAIGRWPVRTPAEVDEIIARTLAYEGKSYGGTAVLAADGISSEATSFSSLSERIAQTLPEDWQIERAYIDASGIAGARNLLINALNGGVALTSFVGHSGPTVWTFQGLFNSADAAALTNAGAPTVVSQMGCWNTYYVSPFYDSLAQTLLLAGEGGSAAVLGATGLTLVASDRAFADHLYPRLTAPGVSIGQAVLEAKRALAAEEPETVDVLLGWTILGDPALRIEP